MSNETPTPLPSGSSSIEDSEVGALIRNAGPRSEVPAEHLAELKSAAQKEWERRSPGRRSTSWRSWAAAAAVVAAVLSLVLLRSWRETNVPLAPGQIVATVDVITGETSIIGTPSRRPLSQGASLTSGDTIEVASGVAALRLPNGLSLRFRSGTRATFGDNVAGGAALRLEEGVIYADSGVRTGRDPMIRISTAFGTATDFGTQFEIRVRPGEDLRLRVREGWVRLEDRRENASYSWAMSAGDQLDIDSQRTSSREPTPIWGPDWAWVLEAAPPFETDSPTLAAYIDWLHRETGWEIVLSESAQEERMELLRGSIQELRPDESLDVALTAFGLDYRLEEGKLFVGKIEAD